MHTFQHRLLLYSLFRHCRRFNSQLRINLQNSPQLCFGLSQRGIRPSNEDRFTQHVFKLDNEYAIMAAVFDGHGGSQASDFCSKKFPEFFEESYSTTSTQPEFSSTDLPPRKRQQLLLETSMQRAFQLTDQRFIHSHPHDLICGSTASVAVIQPVQKPESHEHLPSLLTVGHIGDTRIILCDTVTGRAQQLTVDHNPTLQSEQQRIEKAGGYISTDSFGQQAVMGRLSVTRAIGVAKLKSDAKNIITCEPMIQSCIVDSKDAFLVFVTDGVTSVMSNQEIVDIVKHCINPKVAAETILEIAERYSTSDNSTAVVIRLEGWQLHKKPPYTKDYTQNLRRYKLKHSAYGNRMTGGASFDTDEEEEFKAQDKKNVLEIKHERFVIDLFDIIGKDIGKSEIFASEFGPSTSMDEAVTKFGFRDLDSFRKIGRITGQEIRDGVQALNVFFRKEVDSEPVHVEKVIKDLFFALGTIKDLEQTSPLISTTTQKTKKQFHKSEIEISKTSTADPLVRNSLSATDIARALKKMDYRIFTRITDS